MLKILFKRNFSSAQTFSGKDLKIVKDNFNDSHVISKYIKQTKLLINGKFVNSVSNKVFKTINPCNESIIVEVQEGDKEDVDKAAISAYEALENGPWSNITDFERGRILGKIADLVEINRLELAFLDAIDSGKPYKIADECDIQIVIDVLRYYSGWCDKNSGKVVSHSKMKNALCYTRNEPVGVVGAIVPWNYPLAMAIWKIGPCLAMGNTMILKPAEQTPLSALRFGELALEAGLPEGVLNIIPGFGPTAGSAIAQHPLVDKVAFTGSTEVGLEIMRTAHTHRLKRVSLELGGKSPNIILNDCDLDLAVDQATNALFFNNGQNCIAGSRTFVQDRIYDEFVKRISEFAAKQKIGLPFDEDSEQGPLVEFSVLSKYKKYVDLGIKEGAKLNIGGKVHNKKGYWVDPTVFSNVTDDMSIAKDEIFGPIMSILKFSSLEEVAKRANNSAYGLGAGIVGNNINEINYLVRKLKVGTVYVNSYNVEDVGTPFGGFKNSGVGRELGELGLRQYVELKTVIINNLL